MLDSKLAGSNGLGSGWCSMPSHQAQLYHLRGQEVTVALCRSNTASLLWLCFASDRRCAYLRDMIDFYDIPIRHSTTSRNGADWVTLTAKCANAKTPPVRRPPQGYAYADDHVTCPGFTICEGVNLRFHESTYDASCATCPPLLPLHVAAGGHSGPRCPCGQTAAGPLQCALENEAGIPSEHAPSSPQLPLG
jgi:hypothetical protein